MVSRSAIRNRIALGVFLFTLALAVAPPAYAAAHSGGQSAPAAKRHTKPEPKAETSEEPAQLTEPSSVPASTLAKELDSKGQVDPVAGLGIRNPVCDQLGQIRDRDTRLSCEANGSPESDYPTSNYGLDVFISTGVTHPIGDFTAAFVSILNGIWLGLIFVLKLILELLGLAFGLNPFGEGQTMSRITASIGRLYDQITDPWLSTLVVCGGIWFAYRGLLRRDLAGGVGGTLAAVAMLVLGLWIVHQPRESVGRLAGLANEVALTTISAPTSGSLNRPVGTYAEAMSGTWSRLVEVPFAGLDFSDVSWALSPPPPEAVKRADAYFCDDVGTLALVAAEAHLGSGPAQEECAAFARKRYGKPRRIIDLYLRSSPGSHAREALWDYFDGDDNYKPKVAAQGGDGALTRLSMLALFAIGLLGSILLLAWLAIRLFSQAAIAFVLLLAAPFALFFPLLGDSGRRAFKRWGLTLLGALIAKVIYAALLSIVLLGISILGRVDGNGGSATGFLLASAFTWSVFLKRAELIGMLSFGDHEREARHGFGLGDFAALGIARRVSRSAGHGVKNLARRGVEGRREHGALAAEATRRTAGDSLKGSTRALADSRYQEAREKVAAFETARPLAKRASEVGTRKQPDARAPTRGRQSQVPTTEEYEQARALVSRADRNQRAEGRRWNEQDLRRFASEDRELLKHSSDPADHAHRAGHQRSHFESLRGEQRERAEAEIERARKRDLKRQAAVEPPNRIAAPARLAVERVRQGVEGAGAERREQLRGLRRQRDVERLRSRRYLSRGS